MNKFFPIIFLSFLLIKTPLFAQEITILDAKEKIPVTGAHIHDLKLKTHAISNEQGKARISLQNNSVLLITAIAYDSLQITYKEIKQAGYIIYLAPKAYHLEQVDIVVDVIREDAREQAVSFSVLNNKTTSFAQAATSAEILENTGKISVQKTQAGGGSPILRGFEANKILLIVDGVRMNNAIFRSGHLQNSITIDRNALENVEVIYGAGSLIYGSDALGGVIHYHTVKPVFSSGDKLQIQNKLLSGLASATNSAYGSYQLNFGTRKWAHILQFSYNTYGDVRGGSRGNNYTSLKNPAYKWTEMPFYVQTNREGKDSMYVNPNAKVQKRIGYKQYDALFKSAYKINAKNILSTNFQFSTTSNIQRIDKLTDYKNGILKYADYYYGPQKRFLASANFSQTELFNLDLSQLNIAFQKIEESRISRKFNNYSEKHQIENLTIFSINYDAKKYFNNPNKLYFGSEIFINRLSSTAYFRDIFTETHSPAQTRYPDGGSKTLTAASYIDYIHKFNPQWKINSGIRLTYNYLRSEFNDTTFAHFPFSVIKINRFMPSASINLSYTNNYFENIFIQSTGFRSPNVDDYGKIRAKDGFITMPNDKLKPEYLWHSEEIFRYNHPDLKIELNLWHDYMWQAIVRTTADFNGSDSILYDGEYNHIIINTNADKAQIYGFSAQISKGVKIAPKKQLNFQTAMQYIKGINLTQKEPLAHIPPFSTQANINYKTTKLKVGTEFRFNASKPVEQMSPLGEDNQDEATEIGYPAWWVLNTYINSQFSPKISGKFRINNIFDYRYKTFASAMTAPGRNWIVSLLIKI